MKKIGTDTYFLFTSNFGQKLLKVVGNKKPEWFANEIFKAEAYFTKNQLKKHIDYVLNNEEPKRFMREFMNSMNPYNLRKPGTENDMKLFRQLTHWEIEKIKVLTLIIHGTHDTDVKFYDGVYAYENIEDAKRCWIEEESHLGFWLHKDAKKTQKYAQDFLDNLCK